jgi:Raf kinase inhibitor-like YbhB/YbcL family protein
MISPGHYRGEKGSWGIVKSARLIPLLAFAWAAGCGGGAPSPPEDPSLITITLTSSAFPESGKIPRKYTCDGEDKSPPLEWSAVPAAAHSLALICEDPDAPMGTWSHWVVYNISPTVKSLAEGVAPEETVKVEGEAIASQGKNDFRKIGYGGPCPPGGTHRYFFRIYALDTKLALGPGATRREVLKAIGGHIVAVGRLMGNYARSS